jgi:uncharacterized protein
MSIAGLQREFGIAVWLYALNMHNKAMSFEFDPAKARSNLQKHPGVSFAHAEQSLRDDMAVTIEDPDAVGEQRFLTLGMDALGRILVVCRILGVPAR